MGKYSIFWLYLFNRLLDIQSDRQMEDEEIHILLGLQLFIIISVAGMEDNGVVCILAAIYFEGCN